MKKIIGRLREASTYAGLSGMFLSVSPFLPPPYHICAQATAALLGSFAVMMRDKGASAS